MPPNGQIFMGNVAIFRCIGLTKDRELELQNTETPPKKNDLPSGNLTFNIPMEHDPVIDDLLLKT